MQSLLPAAQDHAGNVLFVVAMLSVERIHRSTYVIDDLIVEDPRFGSD